MVSPQARAEIDRLFARMREDAVRYPQGKPLELRRRDWEAEARLVVLPRGARFQRADANGVICEWMEMPSVARERVTLFLHGGAYNAGSPRTHRKLAALLSKATNARVLTPDYRLAPEHPFPAAVKDALKVYGWLLDQGATENSIVIAGDSAGGGLVLSMLIALRQAKAKMPRAAVLLSPWTDLTVSSPTYERHRKLDPAITRERLRLSGQWYAGERPPSDPIASPLFADPSHLPPLCIQVGGDETMLDDSRLFAERARAVGVSVEYKVYEGMWHVHQSAAPEVPESIAALNDIAAFIRSQFGD